ncbi:Ion channel [Trichuris suis]|nr:Ion channel [Trichuris suis]
MLVLKYSLPHLLLIFAATAYTFIGAQIFYVIEQPSEHAWKLQGKEEVFREVNNFLIYLTSMKAERFDEMVDTDQLESLERRIASLLAKTYDMAKKHYLEPEDLLSREATPEDRRWTFESSFLFAFTLITTIGYGNLTPVTFNGRLFCIIYGLIGIPLVMITIANMGRFMFDGTVALVEIIRRMYARLMIGSKKSHQRVKRRSIVDMINVQSHTQSSGVRSFCVICAFFLHMVLGALCLPQWEELDFFSAFYFSFITITTVGFGDIVPRKYEYLSLTLVYLTIGLALATLMVEVMGLYLRKLHFVGRQIMNASSALVWFGNKMLTVSDLVNVIGHKCGMSVSDIANLHADLDKVVTETVKEKIRLDASKEQQRPPPSVPSKHCSIAFDPEECKFVAKPLRYIDADGPSTPSSKDGTAFDSTTYLDRMRLERY